ncbi:adhesion G protein-coupled receptor L2-like [Montipora foliosa]|uniref:adhesion G protein-coupled receptor L2-like n=1 Tax=Montipora foliosa TaxID=591990 RepID=UPI0035F12B45
MGLSSDCGRNLCWFGKRWYGNEKFCWMSTDGTLIWTFTIPIIIVVALNALIFIMALGISLRKQSKKRRRRHHHHHDIEHSNLNAALLGTAGLLPLIGVSFAFGLLLVNQELDKFHYIFAGIFLLSQGLFIFVFYLVLDKRVRKEFKNVYMRWKTGDKTYGLNKPTQNFTRSYHPGEMAPLRTPYDFDDEGNATSTSTTEPSSSGFRSSMTSRYTTEDGASTFGDDTSVPEGDLPKAKYPDNPELERARKIWDSRKSQRPARLNQNRHQKMKKGGRPRIASRLNLRIQKTIKSRAKMGGRKGKTPKKRRKAPFYASDGPMHSTPMALIGVV